MTKKKESTEGPREVTEEKLGAPYPVRMSEPTANLIEQIRQLGGNPADLIRKTVDQYLPKVAGDFVNDLNKRIREHGTNFPRPKP